MSARQDYLAARQAVGRIWRRVGFLHIATMGALLVSGFALWAIELATRR